MLKIISLGGSIVVPDDIDTHFLGDFLALLKDHLAAAREDRLVLIVGGGGPARRYQAAYQTISQENTLEEDLDWIGIMATRLNAELIRAALGRLCLDPVVTDPTADISFRGRVLVAAGWKPGFSTDFDAVMLAERFGGRVVVNLSNIEQVYTADPKKDPAARPLDSLSWEDFSKLVGEDWKPGSNLPFDPVATKRARELGFKVIAAGGRDLENIGKILRGEEFFGTLIGA